MAEIFLNVSYGHVGLDEMRSVGMAKHMRSDLLLYTQPDNRAAQGALHGLLAHRPFRAWSILTRASKGRKQPCGVPVRFPIIAKDAQCHFRHGHVAVFRALATLDMHQPPLAGEIAHLDV